MALNVLAALGTLAEGSPEGARSVVTAGGVEAALRWCQVRGGDGTAEKEQQAQGEVLQEAALDGLCKVLGQGQEFREEVAERVRGGWGVCTCRRCHAAQPHAAFTRGGVCSPVLLSCHHMRSSRVDASVQWSA